MKNNPGLHLLRIRRGTDVVSALTVAFEQVLLKTCESAYSWSMHLIYLVNCFFYNYLFHLVIFHLSVMQNSSKNVFMLLTKDFPLEKPYKDRPLALFLDPLLCT